MFTTDPSTGYSYFRPGSLIPLYHFELCGLLFALAVYNGISLPVNFPKAFYCILMQKHITTTEDIADGWPAAKRSLDWILENDVSGMDETFPLEANGLRLTTLGLPTSSSEPIKAGRYSTLYAVDATPIMHHGHEAQSSVPRGEHKQTAHAPAVNIESIANAWPGWKLAKATKDPPELTNANKARYVSGYTRWLTTFSMHPQWRAFLHGFAHIFPNPSSDLSLLTPTNLRTLLEGSPHFSLTSLKHITEYENYLPTSPYIRSFWRIVTAWPEFKQRQLLKFVTACERIPAGGAGNLTFKIKRGPPPDNGELPTSSTCFGMLVLPKYESSEVLEGKLGLALRYGLEGFGSA